VVTKNGLSVVGNSQPQQTFQVQQLNANHHELRHAGGGSMYCIYCAAAAAISEWQAVLAVGVPSGN
jgi:hypothetical protein